MVGHARLAHGRGDPVLEQREHEPAGGIQAAVEVDGADHGLHGVGQDRDLGASARGVLALAQAQVVGDAQLPGDLGEHVGVDDRCPDLGEHAVGQFGVVAEGVLGHDEAEHGVSQVLEPLVGVAPTVLGTPRTVGQGLVEELGTGEAVSDALGEPFVGGRVPRLGPGRHRAPQAPSSLAYT